MQITFHYYKMDKYSDTFRVEEELAKAFLDGMLDKSNTTLTIKTEKDKTVKIALKDVSSVEFTL